MILGPCHLNTVAMDDTTFDTSQSAKRRNSEQRNWLR